MTCIQQLKCNVSDLEKKTEKNLYKQNYIGSMCYDVANNEIITMGKFSNKNYNVFKSIQHNPHHIIKTTERLQKKLKLKLKNKSN